jgi:hypothetical protein
VKIQYRFGIQPVKGDREALKHLSGKSNCHSERSEESVIISSGSAPAKTEMFRFAQHDSTAAPPF